MDTLGESHTQSRVLETKHGAEKSIKTIKKTPVLLNETLNNEQNRNAVLVAALLTLYSSLLCEVKDLNKQRCPLDVSCSTPELTSLQTCKVNTRGVPRPVAVRARSHSRPATDKHNESHSRRQKMNVDVSQRSPCVRNP